MRTLYSVFLIAVFGSFLNVSLAEDPVVQCTLELRKADHAWVWGADRPGELDSTKTKDFDCWVCAGSRILLGGYAANVRRNSPSRLETSISDENRTYLTHNSFSFPLKEEIESRLIVKKAESQYDVLVLTCKQL